MTEERLARGDRERTQLPRLEVRDIRGQAVESHVDASVEEVGQDLGGAFVGHVRQLDRRGLLEHLAGEMDQRADARRGEGVLARACLRQRNEVLHRGGARGGGHDEHDGPVADAQHRGEIALDVEAALRMHVVDDGLAADRADEQRVAVGSAFRRRLGADGGAGTGLVLHDHRLAQAQRELFPDRARDDVDAAARRKRRDEADRARRVLLRP